MLWRKHKTEKFKDQKRDKGRESIRDVAGSKAEKISVSNNTRARGFVYSRAMLISGPALKPWLQAAAPGAPVKCKKE